MPHIARLLQYVPGLPLDGASIGKFRISTGTLILDCILNTGSQPKPGQMNTLPPRITTHLRPAVRRLTLSWIAAVVIVATMTVAMAYNARQVTGACWLAVAALFVYALAVLRRLRP